MQCQGFIPRELVANEINWFYTHLGIDDTYFQSESVDVISDHIIALFGAKVLAFTKHDPSKLVIDLEKVNEDGATFIHTSTPGLTSTEGPGATCESRIDELFLDNSTPEKAFRLETYRSQGISATASQQLRCYFVTKCNLPRPSTRTDGKTDIRSVSDAAFLEKASENTLELYQRVMWNVETRYGPVIEVFEVEGSRERRLVIGYKMGGTKKFFSALSNLYHFYSLYSARKYVGKYATSVPVLCSRDVACRTILEWRDDHVPVPQPIAGLACTSDRTLHLPGHERGFVALLLARKSVLLRRRRP